MHIEVFIHSTAGRPTTASVRAWWISGRGIHHAELLDRAELDMPEGCEQHPWEMLAALYAVLASRSRALRGDRSGDEGLRL